MNIEMRDQLAARIYGDSVIKALATRLIDAEEHARRCLEISTVFVHEVTKFNSQQFIDQYYEEDRPEAPETEFDPVKHFLESVLTSIAKQGK